MQMRTLLALLLPMNAIKLGLDKNGALVRNDGTANRARRIMADDRRETAKDATLALQPSTLVSKKTDTVSFEWPVTSFRTIPLSILTGLTVQTQGKTSKT